MSLRARYTTYVLAETCWPKTGKDSQQVCHTQSLSILVISLKRIMCEIQLDPSFSGVGTVGSKWHGAVQSNSATSARKKGTTFRGTWTAKEC